MKNVLITGVSGYIGSKIAGALVQNPAVAQIVGIDIRPPQVQSDKLKFANQDVRTPLVDLMRAHQVDTVIHAAYVLPPIHDTGLMEDINVGGTRNVLAASAETGVSHLLYTSSTTAYGFHPDNEMPLTEESPLRGNDDFTYAKNKKEIEALMRDFVQGQPQMGVTILRPCFVVGPGFDNPLSRYLRKPLVFLPRKTAEFQYVHEDDLLAVILMCLQKRITGTYNVTGDGTMTFPEMVRLLGNIPVYLPLWLLFPFNQLLWRLRARFLVEFPVSGLNLIRHPWIATSRKLIDATGFRFRYDTWTAFADFARVVA